MDILTNKYSTLVDIFSIIKNDNSIKKQNDNILEVIMNNVNISKLDINWQDILYNFYNNSITFTELDENIIKTGIFKLIANSADNIDITKLNHLNRFNHLNNLFEIINELNSSYNQLYNCKNYTLSRCQDYYLEFITSKEELLEQWFLGIFNGISLELYEKYEKKNKSKYHRAIEILKNYLNDEIKYDNLEIRKKSINKFVKNYSEWSVKYLINKFTENKLNLSDVFIKLFQNNNINKLFLNPEYRNSYLEQSIINLIPLWEVYLNNIYENDLQIDNNIVKTYNLIKLSETNFNIITLQFCEKWQNKIKNKINIQNYVNSELYDSLKKISPLINNFKDGINKSDIIIKYFSDIYKFEKKNNSILFQYIMTGLNREIKIKYITYLKNCIPGSEGATTNNFNIFDKINDGISLISLYDNKEYLLNQYFITTNKRINDITKKYRLNKEIIDFEFQLYNYLIKNNGNIGSDKINTLLNNMKNSIEHLNAIHKCKINYTDSNNNKLDNMDISKVDYVVIDKHIWINQDYKYCLINSEIYPEDIKKSIGVGKTYYTLISETKKLEWDTENSTINFNIGKSNIISTILQYTLIWYIDNKEYTVSELIDYVINNSLNPSDKLNVVMLLESYIYNLIDNNIIKLNNDKLYLDDKSEKNIDISNFIPSVKKQPKKNIINNSKKVDNEEINYLRLLMLSKMFKLNSTEVFNINDVLNELKIFVDEYIKKNTSLENISDYIKSIFDCTNNDIIDNLSYLEKRDIIEKSESGYIYVL